jgi:hypothetical protein
MVTEFKPPFVCRSPALSCALGTQFGQNLQGKIEYEKIKVSIQGVGTPCGDLNLEISRSN